MNLDDELTQTFLLETSEQISLFSSQLLKLESEPLDEEIIKDLFRTAHTLKGDASTYFNEFFDESNEDKLLEHIDRIAKLTHSLENLIMECRDKVSTMNEEKFDVLFEVSSVLETLLSYIENNIEEDFDITPFVNRINSLTNKKNAESQKSKVPNLSSTEVNASSFSFTFKLDIDIDPEFRHGHVGIVYQKIKKNFKHNHFTQYAFTPTPDDLMNGKDFNEVFVHVNSKLTEDEIISNLKVDDVLQVTLIQDSNESSIPAISPSTQTQVEEPQHVEEKLFRSSSIASIIRVPIGRIDEVYKHVSNLVISKNKLLTIASYFENEDSEKTKILKDVSDEIDSITNYMQDSVLKIRMSPLSQLFNVYSKDIRTNAKKYNKKVIYKNFGGDTEIDKSLFDELKSPLMHLIRNSIIHGIEEESVRISSGKDPAGTILVSARKDQNRVFITIEDDGRGIDVDKVVKKSIDMGFITKEKVDTMNESEKLNLIFYQGVSTADKISDESGRGVGMDAARSAIEGMKGFIHLSSEKGKGTTTTINLPLTLAIFKTLLTKISGQIFAFPLNSISELVIVPKNEIRYVSNKEVLLQRDHEIPIVKLHDFFNLPQINTSDKYNIVVLKNGNSYIGAVVDEFIKQESVVAKNMSVYLDHAVGVSGCHILGDGTLSLIVDVNSLFKI